ncbi:MAG: metallopeptidase family protein [Nakamurella sp.]
MEMPESEFEDLVGEALDTIPSKLLHAMDNVVILVEPHHPTENLYGLYQGVALTERTTYYSGHVPDTITIYRDPILAHAATLDGARDQVAITVIHEIAHHFGIDDDHLDEWGWG